MKYGEKTLESMRQARWYTGWLLKKFSKYLTGDILEVGSGIGNFTQELGRYGEVWGIDIDKQYLIREQNARIGYGDIEKGQYFFDKTKKFKSIVCLNVLEHINNDKQALVNMHKLLTDDGVLILLVPSHKWLYGSIDKSIDHYRRYEKDELVKELKNVGFIVDSCKRLNWFGVLGWWWAIKQNKRYVEGDKVRIFNLIAPLLLSPEYLFEPPFGLSLLAVARKR